MVRLPEHDHCEQCGDPVSFDRRFCSEECAEEYLKDRKEEKRKNLIFYSAVAASLLIIAAIALFVNL